MPGPEFIEAIMRRGGFDEVYHVTRYECVAGNTDGDVYSVTVEIWDQGPVPGREVQRYTAKVRWPDGREQTFNPGDSVERALAEIHWMAVAAPWHRKAS